jgi:hypothetical protein
VTCSLHCLPSCLPLLRPITYSRSVSHSSSESALILTVCISLSSRNFSEITRRRNDYLREMFVLLQRRDRAELVLSVDGEDDPALEAFMDRFNISKECGASSSLSALLLILLYSQSQGAGSIAQLADSEFEFIPSSPYQPSSPPISDIAHDTPSVLPYGSPMSEALSSPSPLPLDAEIDSVAPPEEGSLELGGSRPPSPDTAMEVIEDVSVEILDEEPSPPLQVDPDRPEDASPLPPSPSSEAPVAETGADALLADDLGDVFEDTEQTIVSVAPSEAGPTQLVIDLSGEDSKSEGLTSPVSPVSPVTTEQVTAQEDMDVDVVGESRAEAEEPVLLTPERRSQSAVPLSPSPQASQTEGRTSPPPPPSPVLPFFRSPCFAPLRLYPSSQAIDRSLYPCCPRAHRAVAPVLS